MKFTTENQGAVTYLVGIAPADTPMDKLTYGMISNNHMSGVARTSLTQKEDEYHVKYDISVHIPMEQFFEGVVRKHQVLGAFCSICTTLIAASDYMLRPENFMIAPQQVYINVTTAEVLLLPIILQDCYTAMDLRQFLKEELFSIQLDQQDDNSYFGKLVAYINAPGGFTLPAFLEILHQCQNGPAQRPVVQAAPAPRAIPAAPAAPAAPATPAAPAAPAAPLRQPIATEPVTTNVKVSNFSTPGKHEATPTVVPSFDIPKSTSAAPAMQIPTSTVKIEKANPPKKEKGGWHLFQKKPKEPVSGPKSTVFAPPPARPIMPPSHTPAAPAPAITPSPAPVQPSFVGAAAPSGDNYGSTTMLDEQLDGGGTTLLGGGGDGVAHPTLRRVATGMVFQVNCSPYKIGKDQAYANCYIDNQAISRSHADILIEAEGYFIRDNNSTNRTYLNDAMVPSGTKMSLHTGDKLRLANEEFIFEVL